MRTDIRRALAGDFGPVKLVVTCHAARILVISGGDLISGTNPFAYSPRTDVLPEEPTMELDRYGFRYLKLDRSIPSVTMTEVPCAWHDQHVLDGRAVRVAVNAVNADGKARTIAVARVSRADSVGSKP